jgi:hypothetical protein
VANWSSANVAYLETEFERIRLLLFLRVLWLRTLWKCTPDLEKLETLIISDESADRLLQGEPRAVEIEFYERDPAALRLMDRLARQQADLEDAAAAVRAAGMPAAIDTLSQVFHLEPFDRDVLLLCLAPRVDSTFERLYAYVQDDVTRRHVTPELAMRLLSPRGAGADWVRFAATAPLRRFQLVTLETGLQLTPRVADYLLGMNHLDEQASPYLRLLTKAELVAQEEQETIDQLVRRLMAWAHPSDIPVVNIATPPGGDYHRIAREVCARLGLTLFALDSARLPVSPMERHALYRLLEREAAMLPCAYCVENAESGGFDELARSVRALLFVRSSDPVATERALVNASVRESSAESQRATWKACIGDAREELVSRLIQQFHFGPPQIQRVAHVASEAAVLRDPQSQAVTEEDLWRAARTTAARAMDGLARKIEPKRGLDELILPRDSMRQINEIASQVAHRGLVYENWGFGAMLSRGQGITALFAGASGTGKTMAAEALAKHLSLDLYRIDLAGVVSKYIGETEKNLRRAFDAAEESGAILFFDEADALFGKRSEVKDSHDRYANIEINYLLQRMEDYRGLAILATNRKSSLDSAFLRRLRFLVDFPFPAATERARIWRGAFPREADVAELDYEFLGRLEIAGGSIANIALHAAFLAAEEGKPIGMDHVLAGASREYAKIDKLMLQSEFGRYYAAVRK